MRCRKLSGERKATYRRATLPRANTQPYKTASRAMYQARKASETRNQISRLSLKRQQFFLLSVYSRLKRFNIPASAEIRNSFLNLRISWPFFSSLLRWKTRESRWRKKPEVALNITKWLSHLYSKQPKLTCLTRSCCLSFGFVFLRAAFVQPSRFGFGKRALVWKYTTKA